MTIAPKFSNEIARRVFAEGEADEAKMVNNSAKYLEMYQKFYLAGMQKAAARLAPARAAARAKDEEICAEMRGVYRKLISADPSAEREFRPLMKMMGVI